MFAISGRRHVDTLRMCSPQFAKETERLKSFQVSSYSVSTRRYLAKAGFFYHGSDNSVKCFYCDGAITTLEEHDIRANSAIAHTAWCTFSCSTPIAGQSYDVNSGGHIQHVHGACSDRSAYPDFEKVDARIDSFNNGQGDPDFGDDTSLASRGFFYDGSSYTLKCWECGIIFTLDEWAKVDVSSKHISASPSCLPARGLTPSKSLSSAQVHQIIQLIELPPNQGHSRTGIPKEEESLSDENRRLREEKICKHCLNEKVDTVFLPCGHLVTCQTCAVLFVKCLVCQKEIWAKTIAIL